MARPDSYFYGRLLQDRKLAQRAQSEVEGEVRRALRSQYLQVARRLDSLYAEAQSRGTLSRTKLWNYRAYRDLEAELSQFCEAGSVIQREAITGALDKVFRDVIGGSVEEFQRDQFVLPYSPRAVIDTAWSGESFSERIWGNTQRLAERIRGEAQEMMMGLKSPATVKRQLMKDYDVSFKQASRLVDTELSYVLNKANLENYRRRGRQKLTIVCLDVNTCDRCKAVEGEVFYTEDVPVLPLHPHCHCAYCAPAGGDETEVTASGSDLDALYAREGVKGYGEDGGAALPKLYSPKGMEGADAAPVIPASALRARVDEAMRETLPELAGETPVASAPAIATAETAAAKPIENTEVLAVAALPKGEESGTIVAETWYERNVSGKPEKEAKYQAILPVAKEAGKLSGVLSAPTMPENFEDFSFDSIHANEERGHDVNEEEARAFVRDALVMETRRGGTYVNYYGAMGSAYILSRKKKIRTAFKAKQYAPNIKAMVEVILNELGRDQS